MAKKIWHDEALKLKAEGVPVREISRRLFGRDSKESTLRAFFKKNKVDSAKAPHYPKDVKIVFWDIETSLKQSYHFGQWGVNLNSTMLIQDFIILSHAWQDRNGEINSDVLTPEEVLARDDYRLVVQAWKMLDEADVVVGHYAKHFDVKMMNARFLKYGLPKPSPYKVVDTKAIAKKYFRMTFNTLKYLCEFLNLPVRKLENDGIELWIKADQGDPQALKDMVTYNIGDIPTLKQVYEVLRAWGNDGVSVAMVGKQPNGLVCPTCKSKKVEKIQGFYYTPRSKYETYRCKKCSSISRLNKSTEKSKVGEKGLVYVA